MDKRIKIAACIIFSAALSLILCIPELAGASFDELHIRNSADEVKKPKTGRISDYSEETRQLMKEAGLETGNSWEEINRRQIGRKKMMSSKNSSLSAETTEENDSQANGYGSKYSYDEFHTAPTDIPANDGYKSGNFDELHINENYRQNVWHPRDRGGRLNGFDEFHYPDEL